MIELLRRLLPLALGVAASPISVVAVLVMLLTRRARLGSIVFSAAWVSGIAVALLVCTVFAGRIPVPRQGLDLPFEGAASVALGLGMMLAAGLARKGRLRSDDPFEPPSWVRAVDDLSPGGGAVVAFANATTSPKNIALALAAGIAIRESTAQVPEMVLAGILYVTIASVTVVVPVLVYLFGGARAEKTIARWKTYVTARAAAVMELTLFALGLVLAAKGLANLLGSV